MSKQQQEKKARGVAVTKPRFALASSALLAAGPGGMISGWPLDVCLGASGSGLVCLGGLAAVTKAQHAQETRRAKKARGVASSADVRRSSGRRTARKMASILAPSRKQLPLLRRWMAPTKQVATPMARAGWAKLYSTVEDVTLRIGGPRSGKTGELACRVIDAPGAVICASTHTDLWEITRDIRAKTGPVRVFNPAGIGGVPSDVYFDPLVGCDDPETTAQRVEDMLPTPDDSDSTDRSFWVGRAQTVLEMLMHAAALGGHSMSTVHQWLTNPTEAAQRQVTRLLDRSPQSGYLREAEQFFGMRGNEKTQSSIVSAAMPALRWLTDAGAVAVTTPGDDGQRRRLDPDELLDQRVQLYLMGEPSTRIAPLIAAMAGYLIRRVRQRATEMPGGRLDPALTMALDEVTRVCPLPLPDWTSWQGKHNITYHLATQSRAHLKAKWGEQGAAELWNNVNVLCVFGGLKDDQELQSLSTLIGEVDEPIYTYDENNKLSSSSVRRVPIFTPSDLSQLPTFHAVVLRRGCKPVRAVAQMAWNRPVLRYARLQSKASRGWTRVRRRPDPGDTSGIEQIFQPTPIEQPALRAVPHEQEETQERKEEVAA